MLCVSATQVGKTYALAAWLLARMWEYGGPHPWWWCAPTSYQTMAGFRLMKHLAQSAGVLASVREHPYPLLSIVGGRFVEFRSWHEEQNLMGTTIAGGVVDEAGLLTPTAQAAISTRRSATLGPLRYIGNPGLIAGPFRRLCSLAEHPENAGVFSFHRWTWKDKHRAFIEAGRLDEAGAYLAFIEEERRSLPDFEFRRLYEAEWTSDEAAVFRGLEECWTVGDATHLEPDADRFVIGVDVAQVTDYLAAVSMGVTTRRLELREHMRGVSYPDAAQRLLLLQEQLRAPIVVERNGPGVALIAEFDRLGVAYVPFDTSIQSKQEIVLNLAADVQQKRVVIADHAPLPYELSIYRYQRTPSGLYRYGAPEGEHDDTVMAACFARWGVSHAVTGEYGWL